MGNIGDGMGEAIIALFWVGVMLGVVIGVPLVLLVVWLARHVSIAWN